MIFTDDKSEINVVGRSLKISLDDYGETRANPGHDPSRFTPTTAKRRGRKGL